jgi:hypothetical protein
MNNAGMSLVLTLVLLLLFSVFMAFLEIGRRLAIRRHALDPDREEKGIGAVEGAIFGLMGLLIAFTFSGAGERFEHRRELITQETNTIGTAWLRIDLLPADTQPVMRQLFRDYLDARLAIYEKIGSGDVDGGRAANARSVEMQGKIWHLAVTDTRAREQNTVSVLFLPALNDMFDITTTRAVAAESHPPPIIYAMLLGLALLCSLLAGFDMAENKTRNWVHTIGFALIMTIAIYVIVDLEYPRLGFIRIDAADHTLVELRQSMN